MKSRQEFLELIQTLEKDKYLYLNQLFQHCPDSVISEMKYSKLPAETYMLFSETQCTNVYIILRGMATGIDNTVLGSQYIFVEFSDLDVLGDYEVFGEIPLYKISIKTLTECEVIEIPAEAYLKWMRGDADAMFMRLRKLMNSLSYQTSADRKKILLGSKDRLILYLIDQYESHGNQDDFKLNITQNQLADRIGVNTKTISRSIHALEAKNIISVHAGKVCITKTQYQKMKAYADKNFLL